MNRYRRMADALLGDDQWGRLWRLRDLLDYLLEGPMSLEQVEFFARELQRGERDALRRVAEMEEEAA